MDAVLGYARLDAGRTTYEYEDVPLSLVFTELAAITEDTVAGARAALQRVARPEPAAGDAYWSAA